MSPCDKPELYSSDRQEHLLRFGSSNGYAYSDCIRTYINTLHRKTMPAWSMGGTNAIQSWTFDWFNVLSHLINDLTPDVRIGLMFLHLQLTIFHLL